MAKAKVLTRGQKAAETRRKNAEARLAEARRLEYQERAAKSWETRRKRAKKAGLLDRRGNPTAAFLAMRSKVALAAWATRRERYGESGRAS